MICILLGVEQLDRRAGHDGGDRVLIDQLRLRVTTQQQAEIVEPGDDTLQLDAVHQEDGDGDFLLSDVIKEGILQVLLLFASHLWPLCRGFIVAVVSAKTCVRTPKDCRPAPDARFIISNALWHVYAQLPTRRHCMAGGYFHNFFRAPVT
ncbi:hypothetical protein D3C87_1685180 [compost metagenome]